MSFVQLFFTDNNTASATDLLRAALSVTSSITAYDAATTNTWVSITSAEYYSLSSTLPNIKWHGTNETGVRSTASGTSFNSTLTVVMPSASTQQIAPAGAYLVGFVARPGTGNQTYIFYPMVGYNYTAGTYYSTGSARHVAPPSVTGLSGFNAYYIRKAPTDSLSAQAYIGFAGNKVGSYGYLSYLTGTPMPSAYSTTQLYLSAAPTNSIGASATAPWTVYNSNLPIFQILTTTTKNW
jgi:hypothetical protein